MRYCETLISLVKYYGDLAQVVKAFLPVTLFFKNRIFLLGMLCFTRTEGNNFSYNILRTQEIYRDFRKYNFTGKLIEEEMRTLQEHKFTLTTRKAILSNKSLSISAGYVIFNIKQRCVRASIFMFSNCTICFPSWSESKDRGKTVKVYPPIDRELS